MINLYSNVMSHELKPVINAYRTFYGGQLIKRDLFDPLELALFVKHIKKPNYLKS